MRVLATRRAFLKSAAFIAAAPALLASSRDARAAVALTLGHGAAPGNPRTVAADAFAKMVTERTNGSVSIRIAGSEQLGSDVSMLTSLRTGALDLTANSQGAASGLVPELSALGLPFLFADTSAAMKVLNGPVGEELAKKFSTVGIVPLDWWDNGVRHTTNSKRPIAAPSDLAGLKIRTPADPMTVDIFQALGATTQQIAFGELYIALQQGVVDGQENPLANIHSAKLHEVNKFISLTGHKWESTPFLMSQIALRKVKPAELDIIKAAAKEAGALQRRLMQEADAKLLADYKANSGVTVNKPDLAAFQNATAGVLNAWKAKPFGEFVSRVAEAAKA
ncbi:TRAP transporter substrate-binding protein [Bradyrhizobium sp. 157]|uniref:TRAP transporter substrate-binding protein n=1 Tax=Bradyrhizobium sp. 157 TaxID=2782631 RepID=UPI001FF83854|nr:TRAP transporter substrate-binding protein [Bradyrhizobium sp. 157]MCK1636087.1 TRAP transporter substrate-binding protein [Bradyrhizobium sp. 157]